INLALTMLLGGLWHGAAWTFVVWGGLHGLYLMIERAVRGSARHAAERTMGLAQKIALVALTYLAIDLTWVFFRAQDFGTAWSLLRSMAGLNPATVPALTTILLWQAALGIIAVL